MAREPELNIKAERVRKSLTQKDMAKKLGISETSYSLKESGRRSFDINEFRIICKVLDCSPETLLNVI